MTVMMECGHAQNSWHELPDGSREPACVICSCFTAVETPHLEGRRARCFYYGKPTYKNECRECRGKVVCVCEEDSNVNLAFFGQRPDKDYDEFYCGCHSWD